MNRLKRITRLKTLGRWRRLLSDIGPGIIAGAADDDPSGIATYSIAGAAYGTSFLWASIFTWPLLGAAQMMCARIGMMTGQGLAGALRTKLPRALLILISISLLIANSVNIGANLSGMADATEVLTGIPAEILVVPFGVGIAYFTIRLRYYQIASTLKWLALCLLAYPGAVLLIGPNWWRVMHDTFSPSLPTTRDGWMTCVAILGTTISPYLFFWQASQEVEEKKAMGRRMLITGEEPTARDVKHRIIDVTLGTFFSNVVMFFVILASALTLHEYGIVSITSSKEAALALKPIAGELAAFLYAGGIIGVGLLAIPTLSGSAAYAFAETFDWSHGLDEPFRGAMAFYAVVLISNIAGIIFQFIGMNPIKALYTSAVINGFLAPLILIAILAVASDPVIMKNRCSSLLARITVGTTAVFMFGALYGVLAL